MNGHATLVNIKMDKNTRWTSKLVTLCFKKSYRIVCKAGKKLYEICHKVQMTLISH
jgi:hypothetical protein